jgi:hypothetical protein
VLWAQTYASVILIKFEGHFSKWSEPVCDTIIIHLLFELIAIASEITIL